MSEDNLVETSPTTLAPAPELALTLVERQPPERAGVLYDPGNMVIEGYLAPALAVARLGPYLRHVHVKNIAWAQRGNVWRWRHAILTRGILDWRAIRQVGLASGAGDPEAMRGLGGSRLVTIPGSGTNGDTVTLTLSRDRKQVDVKVQLQESRH